MGTRLGIPTRSPFSLPPQPSPFVAHFYPVVNSARPSVPPSLLAPDPALTSPNPGSLLASVAARRTDLLYTEFYKNLLKSAAKSQPVRSTDERLGIENNKSPSSLLESSSTRKSEVSSQDSGRPTNFEPFTNQATQLRNFYEGLYGRLAPNDYLFRLRAEQNHALNAGIHDFRGSKHVTSSSSTSCWSSSANPSESISAFNRVSLSKPPPFNRIQLPQPGSFPVLNSTFDMKTRASFHQKDIQIGHTEGSNVLHSSEKTLSSPGIESVVARKKFMTSPPRPQENNSPTGSLEKSFIASDSSDGRASSVCSTSERLKRKRRSASCNDTCPICGVTVRDSEMQQHLSQEIGNLDKIAYKVYRNSAVKRHQHSSRSTSGPNAQHISRSHETSSITATTSKKQDETNENDTTSKENRFRTFQKVRGNRLDRFNSRVGQCRPPGWRNGAVFPGKAMAPWLDYSNNVGIQSNGQPMQGTFEGVNCPVCDTSLSHMTSHGQISDHVMECAGSRNTKDGSGETDAAVDVEDDDGAFEEYEWCGETRVRATTLVHRDLLASTPGFHIIQNADRDDSDQDLNVETDETCEYGVVQFTDNDLIPTYSGDNENERNSTSELEKFNNQDLQDRLSDKSSSSFEVRSTTMTDNMNRRDMDCHSPTIVVQALRLKIQELESSSQDNRCLICMESYKNPLVSIQCWHVHCEKCWMRALGVKKLCPQCNMITPASHLRRIYL